MTTKITLLGTFALLALTSSIAGCSSGPGYGSSGTDDPTGSSGGSSSGSSGSSSSSGGTSSSSSSSGATCDLQKEHYYSECSKGCGDVMVCQSFCAGCAKKCMVPCETSADCEAVGAGRCEISAKASNRCSGAPTKCN